jgi:hypothetical protein
LKEPALLRWLFQFKYSLIFNALRGLMTVKVNDESLNDLLPPKVDSQLIRPLFFPKNIFSFSRLFGFDITSKCYN